MTLGFSIIRRIINFLIPKTTLEIGMYYLCPSPSIILLPSREYEAEVNNIIKYNQLYTSDGFDHLEVH